MDQSQEDRRRWDLALDLIRLLTSEVSCPWLFSSEAMMLTPKKVVGSSRAEHRSEILMKRSMNMVDEIWGSHVKTFTHVYPVYPRRVPVDLSIMFHGWFGIWYKRDGKDYQLQTLNFTNSEMALSNPYAPWCWYIYRHLGDLCWANVGKYTSTMEHMGMVLSNKKMIFQTQYLRCRRKSRGVYSWVNVPKKSVHILETRGPWFSMGSKHFGVGRYVKFRGWDFYIS